MNYLVVMYQKPMRTTTLATLPQNSSLSSIYYTFLWKRITTKLRIFNEVKFIKKNENCVLEEILPDKYIYYNENYCCNILLEQIKSLE